MNKIKRAIISVWDKTGIVDLAKFLVSNQIEIISEIKQILTDENFQILDQLLISKAMYRPSILCREAVGEDDSHSSKSSTVIPRFQPSFFTQNASGNAPSAIAQKEKPMLARNSLSFQEAPVTYQL